MNVGDWVEIDVGHLKGTLARITDIYDTLYGVVTIEGWRGKYFGEDSFKKKPTRPIKEYEDLFI